MERARVMIDAYARSGFVKLHLDASMGCAGETAALADDVIAERAVSLAAVAEAAVGDGPGPVHVIGTEARFPAAPAHVLEPLAVTPAGSGAPYGRDASAGPSRRPVRRNSRAAGSCGWFAPGPASGTRDRGRPTRPDALRPGAPRVI